MRCDVQCLKGRRVIFLGDSLSTQQANSLVGMLGWHPAWMKQGHPQNAKVTCIVCIFPGVGFRMLSVGFRVFPNVAVSECSRMLPYVSASSRMFPNVDGWWRTVLDMTPHWSFEEVKTISKIER